MYAKCTLYNLILDNKGLKPSWRKLNSNLEVTGKNSQHILYITKLGLADEGVYLCKTINKYDLLSEIGFKLHVNEHVGKITLNFLNETILPEEIQPVKPLPSDNDEHYAI